MEEEEVTETDKGEEGRHEHGEVMEEVAEMRRELEGACSGVSGLVPQVLSKFFFKMSIL